jgi:hypothetical protein
VTKMRDEDVDETAMAARHNELRDIHHRIDALKEENERQYTSLSEKLHSLELAVARGGRFPAGAWVAAIGILVTVVGSGFITYHKLETAQANGFKAVALIERHMEGSGERFAAIRDASAITSEWEKRLPSMDERIKALEGKVVGQGPEGWHRRDHDLYARMMDERNDRIRARLDIIEKRQDQLCDRIRECKAGR